MKFLSVTQFLLVSLLAVSAMDARREEKRQPEEEGCWPTEIKERVLIFHKPTTTDYVIKENAGLYDLNAATVCFLAAAWAHTDARMNPDDNQCPFSYAVPGDADGISLTPEGLFHHICFIWSNSNGDYQFYKDGVLVASGTDFQKRVRIQHGGTEVVGQDQDTVGGGFVADHAFVGALSYVNVWGVVLSQSDIEAQYRNCHVTQGPVTWWSQLYSNISWRGYWSGIVNGKIIEKNYLVADTDAK